MAKCTMCGKGGRGRPAKDGLCKKCRKAAETAASVVK